MSALTCLANRPPFGTAANSNPRGAAFQSLFSQGVAKFILPSLASLVVPHHVSGEATALGSNADA